MEALICKYCKNVARYTCACTEPQTNFCKDHQDSHLKSKRRHVIEIICSSRRSVNPASKQKMIAKIYELRKEASIKLHQVLEHAKLLIRAIEDQTKEAISNLKQFIDYCEDKTKEILNIESLEVKGFYSPFENCLISENSECYLDTFVGPDIVLRHPDNLIFYVPSSLQHSFENYSCFTAGFTSYRTIEIYPSNNWYTNNQLCWSSRILSIDSETLLITGGEKNDNVTNKCIKLNVRTGNIENVGNLKVDRKWHASAWLNGNPCVIGGLNYQNSIKDVEILIGNEWRLIESLNTARSSCSAVTYQGNIWVFGGSDRYNLDSIEKFEDGRWVIQTLKLVIPYNSIGVLCLENSILLYGGSLSTDTETNYTYCINTKEHTIACKKPLLETCNFTNNIVTFKYKKNIFAFDTLKRRRFEPDLKMIFT